MTKKDVKKLLAGLGIASLLGGCSMMGHDGQAGASG